LQAPNVGVAGSAAAENNKGSSLSPNQQRGGALPAAQRVQDVKTEADLIKLRISQASVRVEEGRRQMLLSR